MDLTAPTSGTYNPVYSKYFCSDVEAPTGTTHCTDASDAPQISVTYTTDLGNQGGDPTTQHRLNDRSQLLVNNHSDNAEIRAHDLDIAGRGLDDIVDRYYNSASTSTGAFGSLWTMSAGPDVQLIRRTPGSGNTSQWFDYQGPTGAVQGTFIENSSSGPFFRPLVGGLNADLKYDSTSGDAHYGDYGLGTAPGLVDTRG